MPGDSRRPEAIDAEPVPEIVRLRTRPDRFVFTERGNSDGWIATGLVVDLEP